MWVSLYLLFSEGIGGVSTRTQLFVWEIRFARVSYHTMVVHHSESNNCSNWGHKSYPALDLHCAERQCLSKALPQGCPALGFNQKSSAFQNFCSELVWSWTDFAWSCSVGEHGVHEWDSRGLSSLLRCPQPSGMRRRKPPWTSHLPAFIVQKLVKVSSCSDD